MKIVIQRVKRARVTEKDTDKVIGNIGKGLFILLGVGNSDTEENVTYLVDKVLNMRIMSDSNDKMNLSIKDVHGEILVVSQFTLYADTSGGRRPSFLDAATPELARSLYERFVQKLKESELKVETGSFGNYMEIDAVLDGPVTIILDS